MLRIRSSFRSLCCRRPRFAAGPFQAEPTARPSQERFVARDNVWRCADAGCSSTNAPRRAPRSSASSLVREVGALRSFSVDGRAFGADELEACNAARAN